MCFESMTIAGKPGGKVTLKPNGSILRVDDTRLDDDPDDEIMQRRRRVMAVLGRLFPMAVHRMPPPDSNHPCELEQGNYGPMYCFKPGMGLVDSCTSVNAAIMQAAAGPGPWAYDVVKSPAYVPYTGGNLPNVGDTYILWDDSKNEAHHCGIVMQATFEPGEFWLGADGGQTYQNPHLPPEPPWEGGHPLQKGQAARITPRPWACETEGGKPDKPRLSGWLLHGWLDLGHSSISFQNKGKFDTMYTKAHYELFRSKVLRAEQLLSPKLKAKAKSKADADAASRGQYDPTEL